MIITPSLAQKIVDSIIPLVQENINIMNDSGIIIGSGQKNRIHTFHQGAKNVIETGEFKEIYATDIDRYPGSLPGLNWPIVFEKQIVGVVGISGNPDEVRNTAKLVKMVTELLLERENLIEEFQANMQLREQFVQLLLSESSAANRIQINKLAGLLRFELDIPRLVAVVDISGIVEDTFKQYGVSDIVATRAREHLKQLVETSSLITTEDMVIFSESELIILKHFPATAENAAVTKWGAAFIHMLQDEYRSDILHMGLGSLVESPLEMRHSLAEALFAAKSGLSISGLAAITNFDILISYLLQEPGSIQTCRAYKKLKDVIHISLGRKYDMRNTITAVLDCNLNISTAAKALYVHRNTLVFRLEKLKELTGLCPSQFLNHAMLCKLLFGSEEL